MRRSRTMVTPRPFVKWAGGKTQLLPALLACVPPRFKAYHEPFVGGGALFFELHRLGRITRAFLSDTNQELLDTYAAIRDHADEVTTRLHSYPYDRDFFYDIRARDPSSMDVVDRAARMIYLNRTCYNGLYRVNRQGQFNVPFGSYVNPRICDAGNLAAVAAALRNVTLSCKPFDDVLERAQRKDFVYFDPPYDPVSVTACFTSYQPGGFSWGDQEGLSRVFSRLARCGVYVMLSNSATPSIRSLYRKWHIQEVDANRSINSKGSRRTGHTELIITSYPVDSSRDPG